MSCSFALLVFSFKFCEAATWLDPGLKWKTLETSHFSIHFHDGLEEIAKRFAPMAEEVHEKLVPIIKHKPDLKTNVVLLDAVDYGNGWTTVIPDPRVTLYLTDWSTNLNPSKYDIWLKFVFLHEYTHVLHLDIVEGSMSLFKFIFGRVVFPNAIEPWFMTEGIATYMETKYTQDGRGKDPRWEMMMRMDVLEDNLKSIDQAAVDTVLWPMGHLRYLYGVEFLEYLADTYGEDKLITLTHIYGDFLFSLGVDGAFLFLYRKNLYMLWNEWIDHLRKKYKKQEEGLGKLTEPTLITCSGYYNLKPKWSRDAKQIYYQQRNADGYPCLRVINVDGEGDRKLIEASVSSSNLSLSPDARKLTFLKFDTYRNYYTYMDLYEYDLIGHGLRRLTEGMRVTDADLSPDGSWLVFVENRLGTKTLMMMASDGSDKFMVCSYEANAQYFSPRWSPDGKRLVVAKWSPGGRQKLYLVNPQTGIQKRVTRGEDLASEANPAFSPDGEYIFFDSDRTGIVNLYAFHLRSGRLSQVTNVVGGAMMPDVSPDGKKIAYVSYSSKGYDIAMTEVVPSEWKEVGKWVVGEEASIEAGSQKMEKKLSQLPTPTSDIQTGIHTQNPTSNIHDYNPIPTLLPKFWFPLEYTNENGVQTYIHAQGSDILEEHIYQLNLGYDFEAERPQYAFLYANNQFLPQIVFQLSEIAVPYDWEDNRLWMKHRADQVSFTLYDNCVFHEWDRQLLSVGYEETNISNIGSLESFLSKPSLGDVKGVFVAWRYLNSRKYAKSISPEDGIDLSLQVTMNSADLGSDYTYTTYTGNAATYFKTTVKHHVLAPILYGFYSKGDQLEQSNFSWRYLPLRGYPSTNLQGNKGVLLSTEYRFPLWYMEKGFMYGNTFFDRVWGDIFYEMGGATFDPVSNLKFKRSYGLELNLDILLVWGYYGLPLKLGYVKGLDEDGEEKFYVSLGGSLAELLWYNH